MVQLLPSSNIYNKYSPEEISQLLQQAIDELPEKQAIVFNLKYFDEMKYAEMSSLLNTSEGGLKASYSIAVQKIHSYIEKL
jgi:RNA polymerase sigma-70 factor (ECF subfamily)